jgi:hypothetical protein
MCTDQAGPGIRVVTFVFSMRPSYFWNPSTPQYTKPGAPLTSGLLPQPSPMPASGTNVVVCVLVLVVAIVTAILLAFSFKDIDADEQVPAPTLVPVE